MPRSSRCAYTVGLGAIVALAAVAAAAMRAPSSATTWRLGGLTVVAIPTCAGPVVAEAWLGSGCAERDRPLAHLAEHVALAQADDAVLDGRVTPDATILRAVAPTLAATLTPLWRAMTATVARAEVVAREAAAVAAEGEPAPACERAVARHWRRSWRGHRATLVVRGRFEVGEVPTLLGAWPGTRRARGRRWTRALDGGALAPGPAPTDAAAPAVAVAVAAAAAGRAALLSRAIVGVAGPVAWPALDDDQAWATARAAASRLPIVGAIGEVGALAAAIHVVGDPAWPARYRRAVARVTPAAAVAAGRALAQARPAPAPTRASGDDRIWVRWLWRGGPAREAVDERGAAALAAAAVARCLDGGAVAAAGGRAAVIVERDRIGVRAELPAAQWRDGVAAIAACLARPDTDEAAHARDRARLTTAARERAGSVAHQAVALFATARYGAHPLARAVAVDPPVGLSAQTVARWWRRHHRLADAVVVASPGVDAAALTAAARIAIADEPSLAPPATVAPPRQPPAEVYLDGPADRAAIAIGFDAVAAGDPDRAALDVLAAYLADPRGPLADAMAGAVATRVAVADTLDRGYLAVVFDQPRDRAATVAAARAALAQLVARPPSAAALAAALARPADGPGRAVDAAALARLTGASSTAAVVDAAAVARVAARVLRLDDATVATVRPPDRTPAILRRGAARPRRSRRSR